jgi:hypothetical protein
LTSETEILSTEVETTKVEEQVQEEEVQTSKGIETNGQIEKTDEQPVAMSDTVIHEEESKSNTESMIDEPIQKDEGTTVSVEDQADPKEVIETKEDGV